MKIGKIYTLTRNTVDLSGRQITVCRRVKLLEAGETVMVDNVVDYVIRKHLP